jgi:hypothetical protein
MRKWADDYDVDRYEKLLARHINHKRYQKGLAVDAQDDGEKAAFAAAWAEFQGEVDRARALWKQAESDGSSQIGVLAQRHLQRLDSVAAQEKALEDIHERAIDTRKEPTDLDELRRQALLALRQERLGDRLGMEPKDVGDRQGALRRYTQLQLTAESSEAEDRQSWALFAAVKVKQMKDHLTANPDDRETKNRVARVRNILAAAQKATKQSGGRALNPRAVAHDVEVLYEQEAEMAEEIKKARSLREEIDKLLGGAPPKQ